MTVADRPQSATPDDAVREIEEGYEEIEEAQRLYKRYLDLSQLRDLSLVAGEEERYTQTPTTREPLAGTIDTIRPRK